MNRKKAIEELEKYVKDSIKFYEQSLSTGFGETSYYHQMFSDIIKVFEQPITLADFLGWEEGVEYEWRNEKYKICDDILQCYDKNDDRWYDSVEEINDYLRLQQAKRVEKQIAYHVKDEYSYNCLIMELEERGHAKAPHFNGYDSCIPIIYINSDGKYSGAMLDSIIARSHIIVEYHKEEPKFYAKIKGWELIKDDDGDCYWHKDKNPIHGVYPWDRHEASIYTKTEWNKLGINDTNADFEEVEE